MKTKQPESRKASITLVGKLKIVKENLRILKPQELEDACGSAATAQCLDGVSREIVTC
jgi:hypothetical protein